MNQPSNDKLKPVLIIENLTNDFGIPPEKRAKNEKNLSECEEDLLTLIANIIIEVILKEEI